MDQEYTQTVSKKLGMPVVDPSKIVSGPPSLVYAGFEGGASMSQKNLEQARSKFLLDKLTGKLPTDQLKAALEEAFEGHTASQTSLKKTDKGDTKVSYNDEDDKKKKNLKKEKKWSELDKFIELLLDSKSEEETVFMYLNPMPKEEGYGPYDLKVVKGFTEKHDTYYTISGKGLTLYEGESPIEFLSVGQWLIERDQYNYIKDMPFFKQFKKWKFMRLWKKKIKHQNRTRATSKLEERLFILQENFSEGLKTHRELMIQMSGLRFVDTCMAADTKNIDDFEEAQLNKSTQIQKDIAHMSVKSRENI